ncbi:MAG: hypothetical protein LQ346_006150 [Caloplaca aetnensis]|nr:MAG: hypothetical protein LQ346_006150 [Caloplaca aetnensis]
MKAEESLPFLSLHRANKKSKASEPLIQLKSLGVWSLLATSIGLNVLLLIKPKQRPVVGSRFSGLGYDVPVVYHAMTDYWSENETLSDGLWDSIDTSPMGVALSDDYASSHNIPIASRFPWDDEKGTYFIKAFHELHCLVSVLTFYSRWQGMTLTAVQKLMRKMVVDLRAQREPVITWEHYQHCLDSLRQDIICHADDTPMPGIIGRHLGDGQTTMCRDWNKLIAWTQAPQQQACYHSLDDYRTVEHSLERHAFCPVDSEYYEVQTAYFERWGHVDPFVE